MAKMEEGKSSFKILTGTPKGKGPLGWPKHRGENNIRMNLKEIGINTSPGRCQKEMKFGQLNERGGEVGHLLKTSANGPKNKQNGAITKEI